MFYTIIKHAHSGFRWLILIALVSVIVLAVVKLTGKKTYSATDKKIGLFGLIFSHIQLLLGLVLYFISGKVVFSGQSMKSDLLRFFLVEHIGLMIIGVVFITIGYSKAKKAVTDESKLKTTLIFYGLGLVIILLGIPWPWQQYAAAWF